MKAETISMTFSYLDTLKSIGFLYLQCIFFTHLLFCNIVPLLFGKYCSSSYVDLQKLIHFTIISKYRIFNIIRKRFQHCVRRWRRDSKVSSRLRRHFMTEKGSKPLHTIYSFIQGKLLTRGIGQTTQVLRSYSLSNLDPNLQLLQSEGHCGEVKRQLSKVVASVHQSALLVAKSGAFCEPL